VQLPAFSCGRVHSGQPGAHRFCLDLVTGVYRSNAERSCGRAPPAPVRCSPRHQARADPCSVLARRSCSTVYRFSDSLFRTANQICRAFPSSHSAACHQAESILQPVRTQACGQEDWC
jgi:hypothetical protein